MLYRQVYDQPYGFCYVISDKYCLVYYLKHFITKYWFDFSLKTLSILICGYNLFQKEKYDSIQIHDNSIER